MTLCKIFTLYTACFLGVTVLLGIAESAFGLSQRLSLIHISEPTRPY